MTTRETVGWIGTGKMGLPMAGHLIDADHAVRVAEPDAANRAAAVARGAGVADSPAALAATCGTVFVMIPDDVVLRTVVFGPDGLAGSMRAGQTLIEMSTVSPQVSREVAAALEPAGVSYLRAPVSGSTVTAASAKLTVLASGPRATFDAAEPLLASFSARRFHVGEGGRHAISSSC
jgi:3-hydroxyisobutyrate dehydrogenase